MGKGMGGGGVFEDHCQARRRKGFKFMKCEETLHGCLLFKKVLNVFLVLLILPKGNEKSTKLYALSKVSITKKKWANCAEDGVEPPLYIRNILQINF